MSRQHSGITSEVCGSAVLELFESSAFDPTMPGTLAFPKARRLTRTSEFHHVRKEGGTWRGALMTLAVANAPTDDSMMRVGIIASRKVGGAVVRNRTRRRLREIVRKRQREIKSGLWIVVILASPAARADYGELEDEWLRLASRASILAP
jgi:ribonuclease P protein component